MQKVAGCNLLLYFFICPRRVALLFAGAQKVTKNALMLIGRDKTKKRREFYPRPNINEIFFVAGLRPAPRKLLKKFDKTLLA